jgi:membrane protease YdiL (CAAX protease family)
MTTLNPPVVSYSTSSPRVKPLTFGPAVLFFAIPSLAFAISYHWGIPAMVELGLTGFTASMLAILIPMVMLMVATLAAYSLEGRPLTWEALSDRFRLRRMSSKDWLWALGGFLFTLIGFALLDLSNTLISRGLIPLPNSLPPALHPSMQTVPAYRELMGPEASGNWNLVALIVAVLFFNVMSEEFYFRGYLLPRQEEAHGRRAWVIHFVLWTLFHVFIYWKWLYIVAVTLPVTYITYRRQNTWQGIIIHGLHNVVSMAPLVLIIFGFLT